MLRKLTNGWPLLGATSAALMLMAAAILLFQPDLHGLHAVLRATGRSSLVFFLLAFSASALWRLWPGAWSRWQLRNRRYLGLSFAASHTIHLFALAGLAWPDPAKFFKGTHTSTLVFGALAYGFIFALAATSFDRSAAWLGARRWALLHRVGSYYIWAIFFLTFLAGAASGAPRYWTGVAAVLAVMTLRVGASFRIRAAPGLASPPVQM